MGWKFSTTVMRRTLLISAIVCALIQAGGTVSGEEPAVKEVFVPILGESNSPKKKLKIPTGSEEFTVLPPNSKNQETVSVEKFGAQPSSPDNTKAFNDAIAYCASSGASKLIVPKGVYRFTQEKSVLFDKLIDFEFDGQGSTFVYNHLAHFMIINRCERTLFKNFSVDWDWDNDPLASVVKVENVEPSGLYADLRFVHYDRFPKRDVVLHGALLALDPATMSVGFPGGGGMWFGGDSVYPKVEWLSDNLLRLYASDTIRSMDKNVFVSGAKKGGLYRVLHRLRGNGAINMGNNVNLTLSGINVYSCAGAAFYAWGDQHHWQVINTNVIRPAGTKRPMTSLSDHFDIAQTLGYFKMEGCEISLGADDCFCVIGGGAIGDKAGPNTVRGKAMYNPDHFHVGDPVEIRQDDYAPTGFTEKIAKINTIDAKAGIREFIFEKALPEQKGLTFVLFNRHYSPKNIIIRNCYFHDNQARGALLKGENITLENTRFYHNQLGAIHIYSGYRLRDGADGCGASNVVVRNNIIDTANPDGRYDKSKMPAIYIFSYIRGCTSEAPLRPEDKTKFPIISDILIEKNQFIDFPGVIVSVCSAGNVIIRDNTVKLTKPQIIDKPYRGSIEVGFSTDVFVMGNKWIKSPYMKDPGIFVDKETTDGLYWENNVMLEAPLKVKK